MNIQSPRTEERGERVFQSLHSPNLPVPKSSRFYPKRFEQEEAETVVPREPEWHGPSVEVFLGQSELESLSGANAYQAHGPWRSSAGMLGDRSRTVSNELPLVGRPLYRVAWPDSRPSARHTGYKKFRHTASPASEACLNCFAVEPQAPQSGQPQAEQQPRCQSWSLALCADDGGRCAPSSRAFQ